jgi:hypothetical protein
MAQDGTTQTDADRIRELEAEVARLQAQSSDAGSATTPIAKPSKWRSFWSAVCITLAVILAPLSVVAVWARGEVTDTERFVATVAPLASEPAIQQAVADRVSEEIITAIKLDELTKNTVDLLDSNLDLNEQQKSLLNTLSGPLESGIEGLIRDQVQNFIQSELFEQLWTEIMTRAQERVQQALSGDQSGAISVQGADVVLNLGDVIDEVKKALVERGLTVAENIPTIDSEIVIFQSESLASLQRGYAALNTLGFWLPIVVAALALLGIAIANDRRKAVLGSGIGLTLSSLVAGALVSIGRAEYLNALPGTVDLSAATAFFDQLTLFLRGAIWAMFAAGIALLLAALVMGPTGFAAGLRGLAVNAAAAIQSMLASWGLRAEGLQSWAARNASGLRIAVTLVALLIVLVTRYKTVDLVIWTIVGLLVALFIIQILASPLPPKPESDDSAGDDDELASDDDAKTEVITAGS